MATGSVSLPEGFALEQPQQPSGVNLPPGFVVDHQQTETRSAIDRFTRSFVSTMGIPESVQDQPSEALTGLKLAVQHPGLLWDSLKAMGHSVVDSHSNLADQGLNQMKQPGLVNKLGGAARVALSGVPVVGPALQSSADQIDQGNVAGGLGTAAAIAAPMVAASPSGLAAADAIASAPGKLKPSFVDAPLGDTVNSPRGTVPAEAATPAELKAYADANNIPINAAQATGHNFPLNLQSMGERASVGGTAVKAQAKAAQAAVADHAQNLAQKFSPNTPDLETAGATLKQNVQAALDQFPKLADVRDQLSPNTPSLEAAGATLKQNVQASLEQHTAAINQSYANVDKAAAGTAVDMRPVIDEMMNVGAEHGFVNSVASQLGPKRALGIIENLSKNLPDDATFTQAQQLRSALLDESRHPDTVMSTEAQGIIKHLTGMLDGQMESAASSSQSSTLLPTFRAANDLYRSMQEDFNSPRSPLRQVLDEPDPSKVPQKLTQKGQTGGSPYNLDLLDKYGIDNAPVKYAVLNDSLDGGVKGYSDAFIKRLFSPQELNAIHQTGEMQLDFNNPSSPLRQALSEPDPSKVPEKFTGKGQTGGSPYRIDLLDKYGIDNGPVKFAVMGDLTKKDFGLYQGGKQLGGYSNAFLQRLFERDELDSVYKTGAIARSVKLNTNPSGTAAVMLAAEQAKNPLKAAVHSAAAGLTNSESFNNWLMQNPQPARTSSPSTMIKWLNSRQAQIGVLGLTGAGAATKGEED